MIEVERVNGQKLLVNPSFIKFIERTPDTVITMQDGEKLLLRTSIEELKRMIDQHRGGN